MIEIETKTPFDRDRRYVSFTTEGAKRAKGFNDEFLAAGTLSGTFGSEDQFGLSVSVPCDDGQKSGAALRAEPGGSVCGASAMAQFPLRSETQIPLRNRLLKDRHHASRQWGAALVRLPFSFLVRRDGRQDAAIFRLLFLPTARLGGS